MLTKEELRELQKPFPPGEIGFKPGAMTKDGTKALALAHITARHVQDRLDEVVPGEWSFLIEPITSNNQPPVVKGRLAVRGCVYEDMGQAENSGGDDWKAAVSDAQKRCGVQMGIGRYLYALEPVWVPCESYSQGDKKKFSRFTEDPALHVFPKAPARPTAPNGIGGHQEAQGAASTPADERGQVIKLIQGYWHKRQAAEPGFANPVTRWHSIRKHFPDVADTTTPSRGIREWFEGASLEELHTYRKHLYEMTTAVPPSAHIEEDVLSYLPEPGDE